MAEKSRILGIKFIIVSITILIILISDAHVFANLLNVTHPHNTSQLQFWGSLIVLGGLIAGCSLLKLKKTNYINAIIYLLMALTFIFLPFITARSPFMIIETFS